MTNTFVPVSPGSLQELWLQAPCKATDEVLKAAHRSVTCRASASIGVFGVILLTGRQWCCKLQPSLNCVIQCHHRGVGIAHIANFYKIRHCAANGHLPIIVTNQSLIQTYIRCQGNLKDT